MGLFISLYKKKRKPTIERLCPFWTGGNRCGLTMPGEDKASHHCLRCRWPNVSGFPLQAWQSVWSRWSFKKHMLFYNMFTCCDTNKTANSFSQNTDVSVYVYLLSSSSRGPKEEWLTRWPNSIKCWLVYHTMPLLINICVYYTMSSLRSGLLSLCILWYLAQWPASSRSYVHFLCKNGCILLCGWISQMPTIWKSIQVDNKKLYVLSIKSVNSHGKHWKFFLKV